MRRHSNSSSLLSAVILLLLPLLISASPITTSTITATLGQLPQLTPAPAYAPIPAFDPLAWLPIATILPSTLHTNDDDNEDTHLGLREIANDPLAAQPAISTQVSPVTTLVLWETVAPGAAPKEVQVVYSQVFASVPDQWQGPQQGQVGIGTIKGSVDVVKTHDKNKNKRDAGPTSTPVVADIRAAQPEAFVIVPPENGDERKDTQRLERRKGGTGGSSAAGSTGGAGKVAPYAGPPTLALLIAVVAAMVL